MSNELDLSVTLTGPVAELLINRPDKRNALREDMWAALPGLLTDVADKCRVMIVRGAGKTFSAGADISEFAEIYATPERGAENSNHIAAGLNALAEFPHPTLAAVRGSCVGGGCALALACDLRFADETAKFAITPAKMGLLFPFNDTKRLVDTIGPARAKDMLFSARVLPADEALEAGLADRVVGVAELDLEIAGYVDRLLDMSPRSLQYTKQMISAVLNGQDRDNDTTRTLFQDAFNSDDFQEGYRAFLEKRKPDFS
jgi:enoyl-CoA hydratase/carnithine racemase